MNGKLALPNALTTLLSLAAVVIIVMGMQLAANLILSVFLALVLVISFSPALHWLRARGTPSWLAFLIVILALVGLVITLGLLVTTSISRLIATLPSYTSGWEAQKEQFNSWLVGLGIDLTAFTALPVFEPGQIITSSINVLNGVVSILVDAVFVLIIFAFMLVEASGYPTKLKTFYGQNLTFLANTQKFTNNVRRWLVINASMGALIGALDVVWFLILGVEFPILWGILSFICNFIPTIGFWLALIPPFILALVSKGPTTALLVFIGYWLINGSIQNLVQPRIMGQGVNLSPVIVFISLMFWTLVLGPVGAILSVPLTLIVKDLFLASTKETQGLAAMISEVVPPVDQEENKPAEILSS